MRIYISGIDQVHIPVIDPTARITGLTWVLGVVQFIKQTPLKKTEYKYLHASQLHSGLVHYLTCYL